MMISPEGYYEMYLKEKSEKQIMTSIRGLKQEIGLLKNTMEHPVYDIENVMCPDESTRLDCTREYLQRAKSALMEAGGTNIPSKAEMKAANFDSNIPQISKITFSIYVFLGDSREFVADLSGKALSVSVEHMKQFYPGYPSPLTLINKVGEIMSKWEFLEAIRALRIGEWRQHYSTERFKTERFNYLVFDGTRGCL